MKTENRFDNVRKSAVSDVVKKSGGADSRSRFSGNFIFRAEIVQSARRQMQRAQRMRKARMLRALIGKKRQPKLLDAAQTLKFSRINQANKQPAFSRIGFEPNNIVNRIAVNFFRQIITPVISTNIINLWRWFSKTLNC